MNACINYHMGVMEILSDNKRVYLNVFNTTMGPIGKKCISFSKVDEDVDEATHEVIASIFTMSSPWSDI